jgi:hypothetical protein
MGSFYYPNGKVVLNANLAREAIFCDPVRVLQSLFLKVALWGQIAGYRLKSAGSAQSLSAASVQYVDACIFNAQNKFLSDLGLKRLFTFYGYLGHPANLLAAAARRKV